MIYRLKHIPSGLYYQPHKHGGSNLSKRGKIYQTSTHGLSSAMKDKSKTYTIYVDKDSVVYKMTKDIFNYEECYQLYNQLKAKTNVSDWIIEEVK